MTTPLYKTYENTPAVGYYGMSNFGGLEILAIDGIEKNGEDAVVACFNWGTGRQHIARHVIRYTNNGRPYIKKNGWRFYFDQIMRA